MLKRILLTFALALAMAAAHAGVVRDMYLEEIIDGAAVAFEGTVIENRAARDPDSGAIVTYTTFVVHDGLKGKAGATHTIKQIGGEIPGEGVGYKVDVRTTFTVGHSYVVFLYGKSNWGFSSPVGSTQGSFAVVDDASGAVVTNGRDFGDMTQAMARDQAKAKSLPKARADGKKVGLEEFKQLVRSRTEVAK